MTPQEIIERIHAALSAGLKQFINKPFTPQMRIEIADQVARIVSSLRSEEIEVPEKASRYFVMVEPAGDNKLNLDICFPRYQHDCDDCTFLGYYEEFDLYLCPEKHWVPVVIARYGDAPNQYVHDGYHKNTTVFFELAWQRAMELELLGDDPEEDLDDG